MWNIYLFACIKFVYQQNGLIWIESELLKVLNFILQNDTQ
jgi:hypothetical protein